MYSLFELVALGKLTTLLIAYSRPTSYDNFKPIYYWNITKYDCCMETEVKKMQIRCWMRFKYLYSLSSKMFCVHFVKVCRWLVAWHLSLYSVCSDIQIKCLLAVTWMYEMQQQCWMNRFKPPNRGLDQNYLQSEHLFTENWRVLTLQSFSAIAPSSIILKWPC